MSDKKPWVILNYTQADFLAGLADAGKGKGFVQQTIALDHAKKYYDLTSRGDVPYIAIDVKQINLMLYGNVQLLQRAHLEGSFAYCLTDDGLNVARMMRGENIGADNTKGGHLVVVKEEGGDYTYKFYLGEENPATVVPEDSKVPLTAKHVQALLEALVGPDYRIRELQATRSLHKLDPAKYGNPIEFLLDEYNAWIAKQN